MESEHVRGGGEKEDGQSDIPEDWDALRLDSGLVEDGRAVGFGER
jgi:hypothetical protein